MAEFSVFNPHSLLFAHSGGEQVVHIGGAYLLVGGAGDGDALAGGGQELALVDLHHPAEVHQVGAVDLAEAGALQQRRLIVGQAAVDLAAGAIRHAEVQGLGHDLHGLQLIVGQEEDLVVGLEGQCFLRLLQRADELVQDGEHPLLRGGLEQVVGRVDGVALHGEFGGGGQEHDLHMLVLFSDLLGHLDAVQARHEDVQQKEVVRLAVHGVQQLQAAVEPLAAQLQMARFLVGREKAQDAQQLPALVVTDCNSHHGTHPSYS